MLKVTQKIAKNGTCREIPGKTRKMDASFFNLRSRMNLEEPEEDEEEKDAPAQDQGEKDVASKV